ncbi:MAG TPA: ATP-binding protein [Candidatus Brocadiales bacterium]|nr:ATP-binding protein [Candidatus Brocadiales bacterium]
MAEVTKREPKATQEKTSKKVRLRLMVAIPLSFSFFTLASGYLSFNLSEYFFLDADRSAPLDTEGDFWILLAIFVMTGVATVWGTAVVHTITTPLKRLSSRMETLIPERATMTRAAGPVPSNEFDLLSRTLEGVLDYLESIKEGKRSDALSEGVITLDKEGRILQFNKVAERVLGINSKDVVGKPFREFFLDTTKYRTFLNLLETALNEGCTHTFADIELPTMSPNATGLVRKGPLLFKGRIVPMEGKYKKVSGIMITFQDPSEMELIRLWLRQADQMAGLGTMAAGIAHEIRNPLASIRGLMELIKEEVDPAHPHVVYAEKIIKEVDRMNTLVGEVLEFAHVEASDPTPQDVNPLLKDALSSIKYRFPNHQLDVVERLTENLPPVLARPEKLTRALENVILNAFEATPKGGRVTITSSPGEGFTSRGKASGKVSLRFHNTGSFIPPEEEERIFLPFYTTKARGTGLGLPITHRIISSHGGQISVDSDEEKGTTFIVELPTCQP